MKVKLQNKAHLPTKEELFHFRGEIRQHITTMEATQDSRIARQPLLAGSFRQTNGVFGQGDSPPPVAPDAKDFLEGSSTVEHVPL